MIPTPRRARFLRRISLLAAAALALVFLAYGIENVRGWLPWKNQRARLLAQGEKLANADYFPPAIPDADNFALIPALQPLFDFNPDPHATNRWRDPAAYRRVMEIFTLPKAGPHGPEPWPNQGHGNWLQGKRFDLAAFQTAFRTPPTARDGRAILRERYGLDATTPPPAPTPEPKPAPPHPKPLLPVPEVPGTPARDVLAGLTYFAADFQAIEDGLRRPLSRFPIQYGDGYATLLPHLALMKKFTLRYQLRSVARIAAGETDGAASDVEVMLRLADSVQVEPFLISQLVRGACFHYAIQPAWEGVVRHAWSEPQLARLQARFAAIDFLTDVRRSFRAERAALVEITAGLVASSAQRRAFLDLSQDLSRGQDGMSLASLEAFLLLAPRGWFYASLDASSRALQTLIDFQPARVASLRAEWQAARDAVPSSIRYLLPHRHFLDTGIGQGLDTSLVNTIRAQTTLRLAATALGLERHRLAHGSYPAQLDALDPRFRPASPEGLPPLQPLRYEREDNDRFRLWTDADNGTDDGGAWSQASASGEHLHPRPASGDWVWRWPSEL